MMPRTRGRFRLTIRARITLSVALLVALGGGIIVAGLNVFMRFGPVWALPAVPTADILVSTETEGAEGGVASYSSDDLTRMEATLPAIEIRDAGDVLGILLWSSIIALLLIVVLGSIAAWILAGRVLSPLNEINAAARSATPARLDRRVALRGPRDELTDLSDTLDEMLERLERAFRAQQLFAANASHELRTPLATEKALLDMLLDGPEPTPEEYRAVAERLREVNARSIAMGEALLQLTRAQMGDGLRERADKERGTPAQSGASSTALSRGEYEPHDVRELLDEPLERCRVRAAERDMDVAVSVTPHAVEVNAGLMERLLDNLLANSARHGTVGGMIRLAWSPTGSESVLLIENTAAPLDRETRERLHEPFVRGGGRVRAEAGSGLGLAIATAVAQAHGGTLEVLGEDAAPGAEERFAVEVRLPLQRAPQ